MAAAAALAPRDGDRVLDLCAAPGGKSTQLAACARLSLLVANEPIPSRAQILSRNIERMGIGNAVVTCAYPDALAAKWPHFFDKILVDAPCSGEGMFRRHPETMQEWTAASPVKCAERQRLILHAAAQMLRPGGRMVYSTCTFNRSENEGVIHAFLHDFPDFHLIPFALEGLPAAPEGLLRLWPHKIKGEGHFVALLEKDGSFVNEQPFPAPLPPPDKLAQAAFSAFSAETGLPAEVTANAVFANRLIHAPLALPPLDKLRVLRLGLHLGEMRGRVFMPDHALALAVPMQRQYALDEAQAADYLHGEALACSEQLRSFFALTLNGYQLGFGKASNGQMKNHYPKGLRR